MMGEHTFQYSDDNFATSTSEGLCLVDLYADWCGPCKILAPTIDKLAGDYQDKVRIGKLNVDENPATAQQLGVSSIPTVVVYKGGQEIERFMGVKSETEIRSIIDRNL